MAEIDSDDKAEQVHHETPHGGPLNGLKESVSAQGLTQSDVEVVRLLREMRHDLAKLTKISAKASRRNKAQLDYLEKTKLSRRWGLAILIVNRGPDGDSDPADGRLRSGQQQR